MNLTKKNLLKGSITGVIQVIVNSFLIVLTIPVAIQQLGVEVYGVFILLSIVGYFGVVANLGLNASLIKHLAEQGKTRESDNDILVAFILMLSLLGLLVIMAFLLSRPLLQSVLQIPTNLIDETTIACFRYLVVTNVFLLLGQISTAILDSLSLVHWSNGFQILYSISNRGIVLLILMLSPTLDLVGAGILITTSIWWFFLTYVAIKKWGGLSVVGLKVDFKRIALKHIIYGGKVYASSILGLIFEPLNKLLIARFVNLDSVVFFDIGIKVKSLFLSILERLLYPVLPLLASLRDNGQIKGIIEDLERLLFPFIVFCVVTIIFIAKPVAIVWIGKDIQPIAEAITFISVSYLIALIFLPLYQFFIVKGHPGKTVKLQASNVFINFIAFAILVPYFGFRGALIAFGLALLNSFFLSWFFQIRVLGKPGFMSFRRFISISIMAIVLILIDIIIVWLHLGQWSTIVLTTTLNLFLFTLLIRYFDFIHEKDIQRILGGSNLFAALTSRVLIKKHNRVIL
ncbi:MAG: polysaccharide biosynthesis C-terminal domain-containing protein [Bacteroidota bacterium]|nr:polysaccharide biosynthesis C-terminal domain-containing protein [Bacteroidota bacterium]